MINDKYVGKVKLKFIIIGAIILIATIISILVYFNSVINRPLKNSNSTIDIVVEEGEGFSAILEKLDKENYLRNKLFVKIKVRMDYKEINLIPGTYEIKTSVSLKELIKELQTEDINKNIISITIPEGYSIDDMAKLFEEKNLFSKEDFIEAIKKYPLPDYVINNSNKKYNLEGYLYPDTYNFEKDSTAEEVIRIMNNEFNLVLEKLEKETGKKLTANEIETLIIKASLIEKEVANSEEKNIVASVIENRLKNNMKLQFCSTVNYVIGYEGHEVLTYKDIEVESPYNTYKYTGLPVGPICSPGKLSIEAALSPDNTDYLYFVLSEDNKTHYFSKTSEEHEAAKTRAEQNRK